MVGGVVAVIGATGRTGRPLVRSLVRRGAGVRMLTRHPEDSEPMSGDVEPRFAELTNVDAMAAAFKGATSIHYIPPSLDARDPDYVATIIAAAERAGVTRIVYHSVLHSNTPEMPHHIRKAECERMLRHSALTWTVLQPAMYVQTGLGYLDLEVGLLSPPFNPARPFTLVHEGDLAEAAAVVHTTEGHAFATYELAGAERTDFVSMAERLSTLLRRPIAACKGDAGQLVARLAARRGLTADQERERLLMFDYYDRHGLVGNGNVLRMMLGRAPTGFLEAARESLAAELINHDAVAQ